LLAVTIVCYIYIFFFQALNFLVESFGLLNDLFPLPSILDADYPVLDLHLADVLLDVILPSVLGSSLYNFMIPTPKSSSRLLLKIEQYYGLLKGPTI